MVGRYPVRMGPHPDDDRLESDAEGEGESVGAPASSLLGRRAFLAGTAIGAGGFIVAPTVLTLNATPAAASGAWGSNCVTNELTSAGTSISKAITTTGPGVLVAVVSVNDNATSASAANTAACSGWTTEIAAAHCYKSKPARGATTAVFSTTVSGTGTVTTFAPTWTASALASCAVAFVTCISVTPAANPGTPANRTSASTTVTANSIATTGVRSTVLFVMASYVNSGSSTFSVSSPWTMGGQISCGSPGTAVAIAYQQVATSGSSVSGTATVTNNTNSGVLVEVT